MFLFFAHLVQCKNVICPNKTETCMYRETLASDGKTSKVEVQCLGKNGNSHSVEVQTENIYDHL